MENNFFLFLQIYASDPMSTSFVIDIFSLYQLDFEKDDEIIVINDQKKGRGFDNKNKNIKNLNKTSNWKDAFLETTFLMFFIIGPRIFGPPIMIQKERRFYSFLHSSQVKVLCDTNKKQIIQKTLKKEPYYKLQSAKSQMSEQPFFKHKKKSLTPNIRVFLEDFFFGKNRFVQYTYWKGLNELLSILENHARKYFITPEEKKVFNKVKDLHNSYDSYQDLVPDEFSEKNGCILIDGYKKIFNDVNALNPEK